MHNLVKLHPLIILQKNNMQQVKKGDKIKVHYHGKLTNGETFDSSNGKQPLAFEVGTNQVIKGFEEGVMGMVVGDKKTINIPYNEAYGARNPEMVIEMPKDRFPEGMEIEIGMPLMMKDNQGNEFQVVIAEVKDDVVLLDANHPLAGQDLVFDLELMEIEGNKPLIIMP
jgi:FKBP-type peptidyl-prolyl cis-trans isomerase 2